MTERHHDFAAHRLRRAEGPRPGSQLTLKRVHDSEGTYSSSPTWEAHGTLAKSRHHLAEISLRGRA